jgi:hypothetical protein
MYAIRSAHICGDTKGAAVNLSGAIDTTSAPRRGVYDFRCQRSSGGADNIYTISADGSGPTARVYWLPWGQNETVQIRTLDREGAAFFLTSGMSGCHFVGCDGVVMHTAAGYTRAVQRGRHPADLAVEEMAEMADDFGFDADRKYVLSPNTPSQSGAATALYGASGDTSFGAPRAIVMGWKSPVTMQWFFAYQDLTVNTKKYARWSPLRAA